MADEPENPAPDAEDPPPNDADASPQGSADQPAGDDSPPALDDAASAAPPSASADGPSGPVAIGQGKLSESDDKTFGMLVHLLGAFTSFVGPLVIWLIKREESPFVDDQGKESLNFQITMGIGFAIAFVISFLPVIQCIVVLLFPALGIIDLIFCILACVDASNGKVYRYPFNVRLVT